jgi:uncharacterized membrane protein
MTTVAIILCVVCQLFLVAGQLLLKRGMGGDRVRARWVAAGTACLTGWFFLWIGLLQRWELSRLYPFEGLDSALLVLAAWLFLRERLPWVGWVGVALITAGVALVSAS